MMISSGLSIVSDILKPYKILYKKINDDNRVGVITLEPFESGFGITIANSLRRVMFSALEGFAVTAVKISGVDHEFSAVPGVMEDAVEIISALKLLRFKSQGTSPFIGKISVSGPCVVRSGMIQFDSDKYECINQDEYICELSGDVNFEISMVVRCDRGYRENRNVSQEELKIIRISK
jgi:DNA-directed RNA polymerase subunit alpha